MKKKIWMPIGVLAIIIGAILLYIYFMYLPQQKVLSKDPITLLPNRVDIYSLTKFEKEFEGIRVALAVIENPTTAGKRFFMGAIKSNDLSHAKDIFFSQIQNTMVFSSGYDCIKTSETVAPVHNVYMYVMIYRCSPNSGYYHSGDENSEYTWYLYTKDYGEYFFFIESSDRELVESGLDELNNNVRFVN